MTEIAPINARGSTYPSSESLDSPGDGVESSDPMLELARLMVENDFMRSEADEANLRAAREAERRAMQEEVEAMHRAADAIVVKAWVQGGLTAAGGVARCAAPLAGIGETTAAEASRLEALDLGGSALGGVAGPAGELAGGATKARADADAAQARNAATQAGSRAEEAREHRDRVERHTDAVLDGVRATLSTEQQGNFAILGNF